MKSITSFIGESIIKYTKLGMKLKFVPKKQLKYAKQEYTGEADETGLTIAANDTDLDWISVFVHETCHLDQAISNKEWFTASDKSFAKLSDWLEGKKVRGIGKAFEEVQALEHDCEKRSLAKIRREKLPINQEIYTQKANAYLLSYAITRKTRKWIMKPYDDKSIYSHLPKRLLPLAEVIAPDFKKYKIDHLLTK